MLEDMGGKEGVQDTFLPLKKLTFEVQDVYMNLCLLYQDHIYQ